MDGGRSEGFGIQLLRQHDSRQKLYDVALKDVRPTDGAKSLQACQHHIVLAAGTVDNERTSTVICADEHAHMAVAGIE
jgi:hypothetical protein